ncbi:MAG: hypothetical protein GYB31_03905 [Bacteroidetes bacterium]|nr:hypothetical protein [Bacteroidota bacterium]
MKWKLRLFQAFLVVLSFPAIGFTQQIVSTPVPCFGIGCSGPHQNQFTFQVTGSGFNPSDYSYFWYFDDGTFSFAEQPVHTFAANGNYNVYVELTAEVYDDEPPPERIIIDTPLNVNEITSESSSLPPIGGAGPIELYWSRNLKMGDSVTYVIRIFNKCGDDSLNATVNFEYDPVFLDSVNIIPKTPFAKTYNDDISGYTRTSTGTAPYTKLSWTISDLPPLQEAYIYLPFEVLPGNSIGDEVHVKADISIPTPNNCPTPSVQEPGQDLRYSHDPNLDLVSSPEICQWRIPEDLTYTIHFQNTGAAKATNVEITAWLDAAFPNLSSAVFLGSDLNPVPGTPVVNNTDHTLTWNLSGITLRGTGEYGYGTQFYENSTKGFIKFKIPTPTTLPPCSNIYNRAGIVFDCNPAVYTEPAITRILCPDPNLEADSLCAPCNTTTVIYDQTVNNQHNGFPFASGTASPAKPFPAKIAPGAGNAYDPGDTRNYQNINSISGWPDIHVYGYDSQVCRKVEIVSPIETCSNITITDNVSGPTHCGAMYKATVTLTASGGTGNYYWQDCDDSPTDNTLTLTDLSPGYYTIGVHDDDGCEAWHTFHVPIHIPLSVSDDPTDCCARLRISGGTPPYTLSWNDSGISTTDPAVEVNLKDRQEPLQVTVTDANNCSKTLMLQKANCSNPWLPWVIGGLALATLVIGIFIRFRRI